MGDENERINEEEVELIGWLSNNLPDDSNILIEKDYFLRLSILSMTTSEYHFVSDYFNSDDTDLELIENIGDLIDDEVEFMCLTRDFINNDNNVSTFIRYYLIPNFYNESEYKSENYKIFYAPYFD